jgi:hypothetical protein
MLHSNNQLRGRAQEELRGVPGQAPLPGIPGATGLISYTVVLNS